MILAMLVALSEKLPLLSVSASGESMSRDYFFPEENTKVSFINDVEFKLFRYENYYMTTFMYNDIHFDIETTDITEQEFIDLLVSILK